MPTKIILIKMQNKKIKRKSHLCPQEIFIIKALITYGKALLVKENVTETAIYFFLINVQKII